MAENLNLSKLALAANEALELMRKHMKGEMGENDLPKVTTAREILTSYFKQLTHQRETIKIGATIFHKLGDADFEEYVSRTFPDVKTHKQLVEGQNQTS